MARIARLGYRIANVDAGEKGSGPGIDRIGHQEQKRGTSAFFCGSYPA